jgi:DNA invertase Pin-like site-specific DNA recombinase
MRIGILRSWRARVSDKKQKHDGDGLHSQEHRCREYAAARGYQVEAVFHDDVSGGGDFMKRPGMVAMLNFLDTTGARRLCGHLR